MFRSLGFVCVVCQQLIATLSCLAAAEVDMVALSQARTAWENIEKDYAAYRLQVRTEKKIVKDHSGEQILWEAKQESIRLQSPSHLAIELVWQEGSTTRRNIGETVVNCGADKEVFVLLKPAKANNYVLLNFLDRNSVPEDGVSAFDSLQPPMIFAGTTPLTELLATNEGIVEFVREPASEANGQWRVRWVNPLPKLQDNATTLLKATFWLSEDRFLLQKFENEFNGMKEIGEVVYDPIANGVANGVPLVKEVIKTVKRPNAGDPSTETVHKTFEYTLGPIPLSEFSLSYYGLERPARSWGAWYLFALAAILILSGLGLARMRAKS